MDKEKIIKKIRETQQKAAATAKALDRAEAMKRQEELNSRGEERKGADSTRPVKSIEAIVAGGTIEEKAFAIINDYDLKKITGKGTLTAKQKKAVEDSISSDYDRMIYREYAKLYSDLGQYAEKLAFVFKAYQIEVSLLANLLTKWDVYKDEAKMMTALMEAEQGKNEKVTDAIMKIIPAIRSGEVHFHYNIEKKEAEADIFFEGGLYSKIKEQAKKAADHLSVVKAYIEAVEDYIIENVYMAFMPSRMDLTISNVKGELFSRSIIDKKYHRSELNHKKIDLKEPVTEEEELLGLVPDYYEIETDKETKEYCKHGITIIRNAD